ncbi:hypothetical protein GTP46_14160 [Duganella sp. FT135W]|uniref:Uncharacterized protein n=1 Tax=Duganella flavida TaxID=2692175 RepID=A0A6L8KDD5_9BURK|nr:hypothetical protein [Duganella flavida]MYM23794.1 hypothetical protein [Duganella flavida]
MNSGEDWGPYRAELFRRLYKKPAAHEDQTLRQLKKWVRRGFNMTFVLVAFFVAILYFFA